MTGASAGRCFWQTALLLAAVNISRAFGVLWRPWLAVVVLLLGLALIAFGARATRADLGLAAADTPAGLRYGAIAAGAVLLVLLIAAALPGTNNFLHDSRGDISGGRLAYEVGVVVFLLTAVPEELAFRGLLLGSGVVLWGRRRAAVASSLLFGLWHITPTLHTMSDNTAVHGLSKSTAGQAVIVAGAVASTFVAGLVFSWLRLRSRSLVAPVLAHVATNALALTVTWFAVH